MNEPQEQQVREDYETAKNSFLVYDKQSGSRWLEDEKIINFLLSKISSAVKAREKEYESIFKWLLGEEGDFPNLATKPHYRFRTELRQRLVSLQSSIIGDEHICCDGECHHDDCCGKVSENCPNYKSDDQTKK